MEELRRDHITSVHYHDDNRATHVCSKATGSNGARREWRLHDQSSRFGVRGGGGLQPLAHTGQAHVDDAAALGGHAVAVTQGLRKRSKVTLI